MSISSEYIEKIAHLARLEVSAEEAEFYAGQLNCILDLVGQMNDYETTDVEPLSHPQETSLRLRDDAVTAENMCDLYQELAPESEKGLYLVPKVIELE